MSLTRLKGALIALLALWAAGFQALLLVSVWDKPTDRAIVLMSAGVLLAWVILGGGFMWRCREALVSAAIRLHLDWRIRFVVLAILLALLEEAIATLMTNLAPQFGDSTGQAAITASRNYIEVVTQHSVVVFIPMFIVWALLLTWRSFSPFAVMMLFGITGLLSETLSFGPQNLLAGGFWVLVYGLMVYLPACTVPARNVPPARWWHYPLAVILPLIGAVPAALGVLWLRA